MLNVECCMDFNAMFSFYLHIDIHIAIGGICFLLWMFMFFMFLNCNNSRDSDAPTTMLAYWLRPQTLYTFGMCTYKLQCNIGMRCNVEVILSIHSLLFMFMVIGPRPKDVSIMKLKRDKTRLHSSCEEFNDSHRWYNEQCSFLQRFARFHHFAMSSLNIIHFIWRSNTGR